MMPVAIALVLGLIVVGTGGGVSPMVIGLLVLAVAVLGPRLQLAQRGPWARLPWFAPVPATALAPPARWSPTRVARSTSPSRTTLVLALTETRRLLLSPLFLAGLLFVGIGLFQSRTEDPGGAYNSLTNSGITAFVFGPIALFAANACANRSRRDHTDEVYGAASLSARRRTLALCLAGIPAALIVVVLQYSALLLYRHVWHADLVRIPRFWEMLATPLEVLGAVCLGVMIARWLPWRGGVLAGFMVVVFATGTMVGDFELDWLSPFVEFQVYFDDENTPAAFLAGSASWHALYLLALAAMATVGAMLRASGRRMELLTVGAVVTLAAIGAGWAQFP